MSELFHCLGDIPLLKKAPVSSFNIFWNGQPQDRIQGLIARLVGTGKLLPIDRYMSIQSQSKITLNALSPGGLVSSRHMESMAMKSLVFAEESPFYKDIFPEDLFVTYKSDLSDFIEKLKYYLRNDEERLEITDRAHKHVIANHTWAHRVETILAQSEKLIQ